MPTTESAIALPFQEAIDFFRQKTRIPTSHWTDVWRTAHSRGFMVAGAANDALLSDFQASIQKALDQGTTLAEFRRDFDKIVETHGWAYNGSPGWRSRVIYETNLSTAYSAGRYAQMTEPETLAAFPYWEYVHSGSQHPRLQHLAWNGLTLRADDPFWQSHYPPNGWRCGCRAAPVSGRGLARMGKSGPDTAPPIETREWRNPRTGAVHQVPVGIDPGFDYNPGMAWKQGGASMPVSSPNWTPSGPTRPSVRPHDFSDIAAAERGLGRDMQDWRQRLAPAEAEAIDMAIGGPAELTEDQTRALTAALDRAEFPVALEINLHLTDAERTALAELKLGDIWQPVNARLGELVGGPGTVRLLLPKGLPGAAWIADAKAVLLRPGMGLRRVAAADAPDDLLLEAVGGRE